MTFGNRTILAVTLALGMGFGLCLLNGCGGTEYEGEERAAVSGTVTLDGSPLPYGTISFVPASGDGRRANAAINDGSYSIPEEQGPNLGEYKVEILGFEKPAEDDEEGEEEEEDDGEIDDEGDEQPEGWTPGENPMVPARYNTETELTRTIESGENTFDFALESN